MAQKSENYPKNQIIPVGETWAGERDIDLRRASFTFALIDEAPGVANGLGERLAKRLGIPSSRARAAVSPGLIELRNSVAIALQRAFIESKEWSQQSERQSRFRLLTLDQAELAARIPCRNQEESCISLSPELASELNIPLWDFARLFTLSGQRRIGFTPRFGTPISTQLEALLGQSSVEERKEISLVDDHIVTGGTIRRAASLLRQVGITPKRVAAFTQVGMLDDLAPDSVVRFSDPNNNPLQSMDLVDLSDFMVGLGGAWVSLPGETLGQLPYCLPFADPASRASIPESAAVSFSVAVLKANLQFAEVLEAQEGLTLSLADCTQGFARYAACILGVSEQTRLADLLKSAISRMTSEKLVSSPEEANLVSAVANVGLPPQVVLLDVNGTLFAPGESALDPLLSKELKTLVAEAQRSDIAVGLCSDSPSEPLKKLALSLGLRGPILAEMGSVLWTEDGSKVSLRTLTNISALKERVRVYASQMNRDELPERWATEFGGTAPPLQGRWFSFGAGREASVAIFGDREFIASLQVLETELRDLAGLRCALEINPDAGLYGYASIHPIAALDEAKGTVLNAFAGVGVDITMIGDSRADLVSPGPRQRTILVANSRVPLSETPGVLRTRLPYLLGTLSALRVVIEEQATVGSMGGLL